MTPDLIDMIRDQKRTPMKRRLAASSPTLVVVSLKAYERLVKRGGR